MSRSTNHPYLIMAFSVFVAGIFVITCALPAVAGDWKGTDEVLDGVRVIGNPAEPVEPVIESTPKELWRIGGDTDDEDEFFGVISQILSDDAGNVYLLDSQLNEIKVFSPDGEYLRSLGRDRAERHRHACVAAGVRSRCVETTHSRVPRNGAHHHLAPTRPQTVDPYDRHCLCRDE